MWAVGSVFYKRFILGLWCQAEGAIYDMITDANYYDDASGPDKFNRDKATGYVAVDYGTRNATVFLYILDTGKYAWVEDEYHYSGRDQHQQKTNSQYADDLKAFIGTRKVSKVIIDPSAASFKAELRSRNVITRYADDEVMDAENAVLEGIRVTATLFGQRVIRVHTRCKNLIRELQGYVWDQKPTEKGKEKPLKKDDHGPDALSRRNAHRT